MRIVDNVTLINSQQWDELLRSSLTKSFFQSKNCYDLYLANKDFLEPFIFGVEDAKVLKGLIVGYIQSDGNPIKRFLSRRAIINGGPLLADDISDEALEMLLRHLMKSLQGRAIYVEFRNFEDFSRYKDVFKCCGFEYIPHLNFHIDTSSEDVVHQNLGKSRKRDIKTSLRNGAEIVENPTLTDIHHFYSILKNLYLRKIKTPLYPLSFFEYLFLQPYSDFILIKLNNKIIGGTVCVNLHNHAVYEWFACGEDGAYKNIYPSTLATYAAIVYASKKGFHHFDMMGAGSPNKNYGVREFKAKFGGQLVEHGRYFAVINPILYKIGVVAIKLIKKL